MQDRFVSTHRVTNLASWLLTGWVALVFLCTGLTKLFGLGAQVRAFAKWGFPVWFVYVVGGVETFFAVLLLVPGLTSVAAFFLGLTMLGATATHVMFGQYWLMLLPIGVLAMLIFVFVTRLSDLTHDDGDRALGHHSSG